MNKITQEMNNNIIDIWEENPHLNNDEKTKLFNDKWKTTFVTRTLQQRYKNYQLGVKAALEAEQFTQDQEERLAKAHNKVAIARKINVIQKKQLNDSITKASLIEETRHQVAIGLGREFAEPTFDKKSKEWKLNTIEYIVSDEHYRGEEDDKHMVDVFIRIQKDIEFTSQIFKPNEIILTFLGDNIEGTSAHASQLMAVKQGMISQAIEYGRLLTYLINNLFDIDELKSIDKTINFVPESNHGQIRPLNTKRNELPKEDLGYVIFDILYNGVKEKHKVSFGKQKNGIIETQNSIYLHGHQAYASNKNRLLAKFGGDKDIIMGHYHHTKLTQEGDRMLIVAPSAKNSTYDYEVNGGYNQKAYILRLLREDTPGIQEREIKMIKVGEQ